MLLRFQKGLQAGEAVWALGVQKVALGLEEQ